MSGGAVVSGATGDLDQELAAAIAALPTPAEIDDAVVLRARYDDALSRNGRTLVLIDSTVLLLSEVSSAALRHAADGVTVGELGELLFEEFGAPPGDRDVPLATRQIIAALEVSGLVERAEAP